MTVWTEIDALLKRYNDTCRQTESAVRHVVQRRNAEHDVPISVEQDGLGWWRASITIGWSWADHKTSPTCPDCGHVHAGGEWAWICIGCPCPRRPPGVSLLTFKGRTPEELVAQVRGLAPKLEAA